MRTLHTALAGVAVVVSGIVLGSGVSGYALSPANQACFDLYALEGASGIASYSWVPFGTDCRLDVGNTQSTSRVVFLGPSLLAWIAWIVAMTALVGWAARRPGGRATAGALAGAVLLTVCGVAAHNGSDINFTVMAGMVVGGPLVLITRHLLMPAADRSWPNSLLVSLVLGPIVFTVATFFTLTGNGWGHLGGLLGITAGAAASAFAHRLPPYVESRSVPD